MLNVFAVGKDGTGLPTLSFVGQAADAFGFGSSAPVVTSNGVTPGSALVWVVWSPDASGEGAELRAYDAVPQNGALMLKEQRADRGRLGSTHPAWAGPGLRRRRATGGCSASARR